MESTETKAFDQANHSKNIEKFIDELRIKLDDNNKRVLLKLEEVEQIAEKVMIEQKLLNSLKLERQTNINNSFFYKLTHKFCKPRA